MHKYNIALDKMVERYKKLYTPVVFDTLEEMGYINQTLSLEIKPLKYEMIIAGPAFTLTGTRVVEKATDEELSELFDMLERIYPYCVVIINAEKDNQCGHWGELLSNAAQAKGASGVVVDGNSRDGQLLLKMKNWPVFIKRMTPIEANGRWAMKQCQVPIAITGTFTHTVRVKPGDWIFGDMDAVIVIPEEIAEEVLIKAEECKDTENKVREELIAGKTFKEVWDKYERL